MDLDAFVASREPAWRRLAELVARRRLSAAEADEMLHLYAQVSTDLSLLRSVSPDPAVVRHLSSLLSRARVLTAGTRPASFASIARFLTVTFPGALYELRRWWVPVALVNLAVALLAGWWASNHPQIWTSVMTPQEIRDYTGSDFENYYSEHAHHAFATKVWVNNAWVSAQAIAMGVLGLPTAYVLYVNSVSLGVAGAIMASAGKLDLFFGLVTPHGLLELTAVFVAGGVGLRLFWSWVEPGDIGRGAAFAAAGRQAVAVAAGLVLVLALSGVIEGFVTPSGLPTWARVGIGVIAELAFLLYVFVQGRKAYRSGATGDVESVDREARAPSRA